METSAPTKFAPTVLGATIETVSPTATLPSLPAPLPVEVKPSKLAVAWERMRETPHGRAMRTVVGGLGGFAACITPPIVLAAIGNAVGAHHAYEYSAGFGIGLGVVGGFLTGVMQFPDSHSLVPTFKRLGHKYPYFASCLNVTMCTGLPAAAAGFGAAHYLNGGWGVAAAVVGGVLGAIYCAMAQEERSKDADALEAQKKKLD